MGVIVKHRVRGSGAVWRLWCALAAAPAAVLAAANVLAADPSYQIRLLRDGTELEMIGEVSRESAADIDRMLAQNPRVTVLQLTSEGGEMGAAFWLVKSREIALIQTR